MTFLSGCNQISNPLDTEKNKFVGTWAGSSYVKNWIGGQEDVIQNQTFIFSSDGTLYYIIRDYSVPEGKTLSGFYELKNGRLIITIGTDQVFDYYFSNDGNTLTLTELASQRTFTYTKQ